MTRTSITATLISVTNDKRFYESKAIHGHGVFLADVLHALVESTFFLSVPLWNKAIQKSLVFLLISKVL